MARAREHHFETEVSISPERAFQLLTDFARHTEWHKELVEVVVEPPGPIHVGQRFRKSRETPMGTMTFEAEITDCDLEGRGYADVVIDSAMKGTTASWRVEPTPDGSKLVCDISMVLGGKLKLFAPMVDSATAKDHAETMAKFKDWAEAQSR